MNKIDFKSFLTGRNLNQEFEKYELVQFSRLLQQSFSGKYLCIAGGAVRRTIMNQILNTDIDIFFSNISELELMKKSFGASSLDIEFIRETPHAFEYTYFNSYMFRNDFIKIQLVKEFQPNIVDLLQNFDYTICQFAIDPSASILTYSDESLKDLVSNEIHLAKIRYPVDTLRRAFKYYDQGFSIPLKFFEEYVTRIRKKTIGGDMIPIDRLPYTGMKS